MACWKEAADIPTLPSLVAIGIIVEHIKEF